VARELKVVEVSFDDLEIGLADTSIVVLARPHKAGTVISAYVNLARAALMELSAVPLARPCPALTPSPARLRPRMAPVLHGQTVDPLEFPDVVRHDHQSVTESGCSDQEIEGSDGSAAYAQCRPYFSAAIGACGVEREHLERVTERAHNLADSPLPRRVHTQSVFDFEPGHRRDREIRASIRFVFLAPALCLQLPSDSQSPPTPLPFG